MSLGVSVLRDVEISVPQGLAGDHVPAHPDGEDRSSRRELLKKHRLSGLLCKVADIEGQGTLPWWFGLFFGTGESLECTCRGIKVQSAYGLQL